MRLNGGSQAATANDPPSSEATRCCGKMIYGVRFLDEAVNALSEKIYVACSKYPRLQRVITVIMFGSYSISVTAHL